MNDILIIIYGLFIIGLTSWVVISAIQIARSVRKFEERFDLRQKHMAELIDRANTMTDDEKIVIIRQLIDGTYQWPS